MHLSNGATRGYVIPIGGGESRRRNPTILRRFVEICGDSKGEVPGILRHRFLQLGAPAEILDYQEHELEGVRAAVEWSRIGDVLILLIHEDVDGVTEYLSNRSR